MIDFTDEQLERYSRHIILQDVGIEGQARILQSRVLIIGAGGLGAPVALYLAAAGVGTIGIVDGDRVDVSNLQRQVIHFTSDIGRPKVESATDKIRAINPGVKVEILEDMVRAANVRGAIRGWDFVIDGTDNFAAKFLINDACVMEGVPYSHGGIIRWTGQTMTVLPGRSACYRCVFAAPPPKNAVPTCSQAGVLGAVAGMLGTIQAAEALKFITKTGQLLSDRLLMFDASEMAFRRIAVKRRTDCPVCGTSPTIRELVDEEPAICELRGGTSSKKGAAQ